MSGNDRPAAAIKQQNSLKEAFQFRLPAILRTERYFTRPLAALLVRPLLRTRITPNQVTWMAFALGAAAAGLFAWGTTRGSLIAAGLLVQFSSIVDCADGMLARAKNLCSRNGAILDLSLDRVIDFLLFMGIIRAYWLRPHSTFILQTGIVISGAYFLQTTLYYLHLIRIRSENLGGAAEIRGLSLTSVTFFACIDRLDLCLIIVSIVTLAGIPLHIIRLLRPPAEKTEKKQSARTAEYK